MKFIYAVLVWPEYGMPRHSCEAYTTLEAAQKFIEGRGDLPECITPFKYKGRTYSYTIHELNLR